MVNIAWHNFGTIFKILVLWHEMMCLYIIINCTPPHVYEVSLLLSSKWRNTIQTDTFKNNTHYDNKLVHCCLFLYDSRWAISICKTDIRRMHRTVWCEMQKNELRKEIWMCSIGNENNNNQSATILHIKHFTLNEKRKKWSILFSLRPHSNPHGTIQSHVKVCASLDSWRSGGTQKKSYFDSTLPLSLIQYY